MNQFKKYTATVLSLTCILALSACSSEEEAPPVVTTPQYQTPTIPTVIPPAATVIPEVVTPAPETLETPGTNSDLAPADILTSATVDPNWTDEQKYEQYADRVLENVSELAVYLQAISDFEIMDESLFAHVEEINGKIDRKVNKLYTNLENVPAEAQGIHAELVDAYEEFFGIYEESCIALIELAILSETPEESLSEEQSARMVALVETMDTLEEPLTTAMVRVEEADARLDAILLNYLDQTVVDEIMEKYDLT